MERKFKQLLPLSLFIASMGSPAVYSGEPLILYATHYPPFNIEAENGPRGFDVEVVEAAFSAVGVDARVEFLPWKRIMRDVKAGQAAGAVSCRMTATRKEFALFSDPISFVRLAMISRRDKKELVLQEIEDMRDRKVIVVDGWATQKDLQEKGIAHTAVTGVEQGLHFLMRSNQDVFYTGWEAGAYSANTLEYLPKLKFAAVGDRESFPNYLCLSKQWPDYKNLTDQFNLGLAKIRHEGIIKAIYARYGLDPRT